MYQNFYATKLLDAITDSATSVTVEVPPTATEGRLVLEARSTSNREIIQYTGVSSNTLTGVSRGQGGTTARAHNKGALVEMNVTAEDLTDALGVPNDIITRDDETVADHVVGSGLTWTIDTGLNGDMTGGVVYIQGYRRTIAAINNRTFTASRDTYVYVEVGGTVGYSEVNNAAAAPALPADSMWIAYIVTNATDITLIRQGGSDSYNAITGAGNPIYNTLPFPKHGLRCYLDDNSEVLLAGVYSPFPTDRYDYKYGLTHSFSNPAQVHRVTVARSGIYKVSCQLRVADVGSVTNHIITLRVGVYDNTTPTGIGFGSEIGSSSTTGTGPGLITQASGEVIAMKGQIIDTQVFVKFANVRVNGRGDTIPSGSAIPAGSADMVFGASLSIQEL